jgi:hypothetical protein
MLTQISINTGFEGLAPANVPQFDLGELSDYDASHINQGCACSSVG